MASRSVNDSEPGCGGHRRWAQRAGRGRVSGEERAGDAGVRAARRAGRGVAAAYLAKSGLGTLVCERRDALGGAAVSEQPFGPGYTVTTLSYVVSLLPD